MINRFHEIGTVSCFENIWRACFPHVKIRQFKFVCGKCKTCKKLSSARRSFHDMKTREQITTMHALHRSMYMGERLSYYDRRNEAMSKPSTVWSIISDGMAQMHCQLPHQGHLADFPVKLPQHIQGVLVHGKLMDIHRTFHNVNNNANANAAYYKQAHTQASSTNAQQVDLNNNSVINTSYSNNGGAIKRGCEDVDCETEDDLKGVNGSGLSSSGGSASMMMSNCSGRRSPR